VKPSRARGRGGRELIDFIKFIARCLAKLAKQRTQTTQTTQSISPSVCARPREGATAASQFVSAPLFPAGRVQT
jgi:hypothetical protein